VYKEGKIIKHPKTGAVIDVQRIETGKIVVVNVRDKIAEGKILQEESPGSISYGQLVSTTVGNLQPINSEIPQDAALEKALTSSTQPSKKGNSPGEVVGMLRSSNLGDKANGAKIVAKLYKSDSRLLDIVNDELLKGYNSNLNDRNYVEAMAWLCNALGASGQARYASTLEKVSQDTPNRKLQKYALKNLRHLR
jgi:hypothetical protein